MAKFDKFIAILAEEARDKCSWCGKALTGEFIHYKGKKFCGEDRDCVEEHKAKLKNAD